MAPFLLLFLDKSFNKRSDADWGENECDRLDPQTRALAKLKVRNKESDLRPLNRIHEHNELDKMRLQEPTNPIWHNKLVWCYLSSNPAINI